MIISEKQAFDEVKKSIDLAMEEIRKCNPELYLHLCDTIKMNDDTYTFSYEEV